MVKKKTDQEIVEWWRAAALAWVKLMPPSIRSLDGERHVRLPQPGSDEQWIEAGFTRSGDGWRGGNSPRDLAARELAGATAAVAGVATRLRIGAAPALKFEELLRRAMFPAMAHYTLCDATEFLVMEIETILGQIQSKVPKGGHKLDPVDKTTLKVLKRERRSVKLNDLAEMVSQQLPHGIVMPEESAYRKRLRRLKAEGEIDGNSRGLYWHPGAGESGQ